MASMLASKLRGDFHLVSANVINHARLTWVHGMLGAMLVRCLLGHAPRLSITLGMRHWSAKPASVGSSVLLVIGLHVGYKWAQCPTSIFGLQVSHL